MTPTWPEIVTRLRDTLARCDRDTDLELSSGARGMRLLVRRDVIRVTCPGYDEARLAALGWHRPAGGTRWWYETPRAPERLEPLSVLVARTAAEVLTDDPGTLSCRPVPPADPATGTPGTRAGSAEPAPGGDTDAAGSVDPAVAALLAAAADRRDLPGYLGVLAGATVCVPLAGEPTPGADFPWTVAGDATGGHLLPVFTSPAALTAFAGDGVPFVALPCAELFEDWPDPSWGLAVDPGTPRAVALSAPALAALIVANAPTG
ncbi:SseB family protein [Micromonospora krabiensis]|uniref:SseB protein N-terminal domain-containing protein n=1 Tax=Micromonospora krabiensis TaxID=307121 RepID=A0A1C3N0R0_9ACTN|nr:SseB family protein [Micromonospora krabiensis]SBV26141.1 SseB protein N-terminal domain-containing protein [Micromonospora krabiensis]